MSIYTVPRVMLATLGLMLGATSHGGSTSQQQQQQQQQQQHSGLTAPLLLSNPAACSLPSGLGRAGALSQAQDQQEAAFAWASRGSLRRAVPCFAAALQHSAHHAWLWVDYARALQGAVRNEERAVRGCDGVDSLRLWGAELNEAEAASHVALLLEDQRDLDAAQLVQHRLAKTFLRHEAIVSRCWNHLDGRGTFPNASRQSASNTAWLVATVATGGPRSLSDAIELGKAWCTGPTAGTVSFGEGWATAVSVRDALLALRVCGVVRLRNLWRPPTLDAVATAHRRDFEEYLQSTEADHPRTNTTSTTVSGSRSDRSARRGVQRWRGRWESQIPFAPPFNDPALTMNPILLAVLQSALGSARLELDTFTQITSIGGAASQPFHADVGPLWRQQRRQQAAAATPGGQQIPAQLAPHGFVCVVPLLNISSKLRGPTEFQVASHFLPAVSGSLFHGAARAYASEVRSNNVC